MQISSQQLFAFRVSVPVRVLFMVALLTGLALLAWYLVPSDWMALLTHRQALRDHVIALGLWGPFAIVALMIATNVMSPLPTSPIALVAGAVYGPMMGTAYVVVGATLGAFVACLLTRRLGNQAAQRWHRVRPFLNWLSKDRSQTRLMTLLFLSRLVPFISFAAVSYAMGFTTLSYWRFLLATLVGAVPVAYLVTASGELFATIDSLSLTAILILVSGLALLAGLAGLTLKHLETLKE